MKRLLDESTDELTRSLLQAGVEHRPPAGNKRQLIMAMGAGGALGLFSSNAFAWLGTTAGKVTAAGVAVGVAGAVFVAGPLLRPSESSSRAPQQAISAARPSAERTEEGARGAEPSSALAERPVVEPALPGADKLRGEGVGDSERDLSQEAAQAASDEASEPPVATERRATSNAQKKAQSKKASGRKARASASLQKKKGAAKKRGAAVASTAGETAASAAASDGAAGKVTAADARRAALDAEVRLVDDMHRAARRNDREALGRLVSAYRSEFPDGQLKKEVADFEASLEPLHSSGIDSR